jgi:hypothetical protein
MQLSAAVLPLYLTLRISLSFCREKLKVTLLKLPNASHIGAATVWPLLVQAVQLHDPYTTGVLCRLDAVAPQLSTADAAALLQQAAEAAPVSRSPCAATVATFTAIVSALCSLPAVQQFDGETLGAVLHQTVLHGSRCSIVVEGLCQLPAVKQLSRSVVDGLAAAAGACGSRPVLQALAALGTE